MDFKLMSKEEYENKLIDSRCKTFHPNIELLHRSYMKLRSNIRASLSFKDYIEYINDQEFCMNIKCVDSEE